ncbi:hypothetical protein EK904_005975 [Melospiza melodia maxima]|nr:hypothetical protein EK904_005975 [Melospiza melodia maxima]
MLVVGKGSFRVCFPFQSRDLPGQVIAALRVPRRVDHERIRAVGPDRAASEWLLRCGALVRYQGSPKWQQDYNALPTGPLGRYVHAANPALCPADGLEHVRDIKLEKCMYIQDQCLQRLGETSTLQKSLQRLKIISCGNVTDTGILALHRLANLKYLYLSDLPGIREKEKTVRVLQQALPKLELELDLE